MKLALQAFEAVGRHARAAGMALLIASVTLAQAQGTDAPAAPTTPATPAASSTCGASESTPPCGGGGPASQGSAQKPSLGAGNPIHLATGNKHQTEVDMPALPGVLGLELVRHYNSARSRPDSFDLGYGRGWRLSYETQLYVIGSTVQIAQADGSRVIFSRDLQNPSHCAGRDPQQGFVQAQRTARGEQYIWHWANGRRLHFDEAGHLDQILAPTGEFVTLQHDRDGRLLRVTDPQGRSLNLRYPEPSQPGYRGVSAIDTPVGRYDYRYGGALPAGSKAEPNVALARLLQVISPADAQGRRSNRHYFYEDPRQPTLLTGIAAGFEGSEPQRLVTWAYDERGRAILSLKGPAGDPASERIVLRYVEPASPAVKKAVTEVITPRGVTTYEHAVIGGEHRLLQARGPGCASCAETDRAYGYDEQGRLVQTSRLDAKGQPIDTVRSERDALGRVVRVERIEGAASTSKQAKLFAQRTKARLLARYEYTDRQLEGRRIVPGFEPSLVAEPSGIEGREHQWRIERNEAGQVVRMTETGYSPIDQGKPSETAIERSTSYRYQRINGRSVLVAIDGPLPNGAKAEPSDSDVTRFEWDERAGTITRVVQPGSLVDELRYDAAGRVIEARNDEGHATRFEHDALGHITRLTRGWFDPARPEALRHATTQVRSYDAPGRPIESGYATSPEPKDYRGEWRLAYDAAGRVQQLASASGALWTQSTDTEGRVVEARLRSASFDRTWRYRYDESGRIASTDDSALEAQGQEPLPSARYLYDEAGRGAAFDALARPVRRAMRTQHRDASRSLRAANGATTREQYDDFGRLVALDSADSGRSVRWFDPADRLVRMRDALGHEARYDYDVQGRIVEQVAGAPTQTVHWRYQGRRLVEVQSQAQTERYGYDEFGRRTHKTVTLHVGASQVAATTAYSYDDQGRLQTQSLADGSLIVYERDGQGQITALRRETIATPWLRWLAQAQKLASDIQRDAGGLTHYQAGNGIHTEWQRSRAGVLARLVHRSAKPLTQAQARTAFLDILGIGSALAQEQTQAQAPTGKTVRFDAPRDPLALIDHRYLWDRAGNLLLEQSGTDRTGYAYDAANRLIVAQRVAGEAVQPVKQSAQAEPASIWRYHHDANGNRLIAQEGQTTQRADYAEGSNRTGETDAAGQTTKLGGKQLEWDAIGRLMRVKGQDFEASYTYSHRGERIGKTVQHGSATTATGYLYDDAGRIAAELNAQGRITRLVVHMADMPLAVIDGEAQPAAGAQDAWQRIAHDLKRAWHARQQTTAFLHLNYLGAPEAATDKDGAVMWTASYAPYGRASTASATGFVLQLRLPGQYEDAETGLYDNRHRTYDPDQGRYLSADPLGLKGGANGFVYVNANPLRYVDPDGLVLFAFDGTGNDESNPATASNVVNFRNLYDPANSGAFPYYITGPGTYDPTTGIGPTTATGRLADSLNAATGPARISAMVRNLWSEAEQADDATSIDIDIIGFSRGAAQAREFANEIVANTQNGCYTYTDDDGNVHHQRVNFRFMGLFDTVLSAHTGNYNLQIPTEFAYVAQAVALNEYRALFPGESIMGGAQTGGTRIEQGFLGAHPTSAAASRKATWRKSRWCGWSIRRRLRAFRCLSPIAQ